VGRGGGDALAPPVGGVRRIGCAALAVLVLSGCGGGSGGKTSAATTGSTTVTIHNTSSASSATLARGFRLTSPAFSNGGKIPTRYTCAGAGQPIPLHWTGVPRRAKELVLVMRDPDAPDGPFLHWALAGINPSTHSVPARAVAARNSSGTDGYAPPCPPPGAKPHHYVITLSALAAASRLKSGFNPDQLRTSAVGIATLVGTFGRS
jgi:Raf kinase inhibitor-like YbhB/YbcL family protein